MEYDGVLTGVIDILETARRTSARAVNAAMTAAYWEIGRRIFECQQGGEDRAEYGKQIIPRLAADLTARFGRGFSKRNLEQMRLFHRLFPIAQTASAQSEQASSPPPQARIAQTPSAQIAGTPVRTISELPTGSIIQPPSTRFDLTAVSGRFPLPWSHYVLLLKVEKPEARGFYEAEALRGGWSARQLDRQITTLFYERTLASRNKRAMLTKGSIPAAGETLTPEQELKDPLILEFLGLKDEYSESALEEALIQQLESFLLELGGDFTFVGRQKRLRINDEWYRVDLVFFHRTLRCLVVIDLKVGKFTHADAGQMLLYLGYAAEHWTRPGENPPVGLVLCAQRNQAVAHYTLNRLPDKVLAAEYRLVLPEEKTLVEELRRTQAALQSRMRSAPSNKRTRRKK